MRATNVSGWASRRDGTAAERREHPVVGRQASQTVRRSEQPALEPEVRALLGIRLDVDAVHAHGRRAEARTSRRCGSSASWFGQPSKYRTSTRIEATLARARFVAEVALLRAAQPERRAGGAQPGRPSSAARLPDGSSSNDFFSRIGIRLQPFSRSAYRCR
jgi:hypothetical protein